MTPQDSPEARIAEIRERLQKASTCPWRVAYRKNVHRSGSPVCLETCGKGDKPLAIEHDEDKGHYGTTELHIMPSDFVDDVVDAEGGHLICTGHDYDEGGYIGANDAEFIAHAPSDVEYLLARLHEQAQKIARLKAGGGKQFASSLRSRR